MTILFISREKTHECRARIGLFAEGREWGEYARLSDGGGAADDAAQVLGVGDGVRARFALAKAYGDTQRRITRPVAGSVRVAVGGVETSGFSVMAGGFVELDAAPAAGVTVSAGFLFDVAVRFAEDRLSVNRATFLAGAASAVPLVEVREPGA